MADCIPPDFLDQVNVLYDRFTSQTTVLSPDEKSAVEATAQGMLSSLGPTLPESMTTIESKGQWYYIVGKLSVICPSVQMKDAESALSKAVKCTPQNAEAWVCLGEVYWRRNMIEPCRRALETALTCCGESSSLLTQKIVHRELGRVVKHCGSNPEEKQRFRMRAIEAAKTAVTLDPRDGSTWYVLGHALLAQFIAGGSGSVKDMKTVVQAFRQAHKASGDRPHPDVLFNLGVVLKYLGRFGESHMFLMQAVEKDPVGLGESGKALCLEMSQTLARAKRMISNHGGTSQRTLQKKLPSSGRLLSESLSEPGGGPVPLLLLDIVSPPQSMPVVCVGLDRSGVSFVLVLLYNLNGNSFKCYDTVTAMFPASTVETVDSCFDGVDYKFSVVIPDYATMLWNGKPAVGRSLEAMPVLQVKTFA